MIFIMIISLMGVFIQHALLIFSVFVRQEDGAAFNLDLFTLVKQALCGLIVIPPSIYFIQMYWKNWRIITKKMKIQMTEKN